MICVLQLYIFTTLYSFPYNVFVQSIVKLWVHHGAESFTFKGKERSRSDWPLLLAAAKQSRLYKTICS